MDVLEIIFRILFAIVASGFIGYERELRNRPAGFRTHVLVCVGSTVVALIQVQMMYQTLGIIQDNPALANSLKADSGRVVAQVITGVGFLGAGTIMFHKGNVKGLTTATTLWIVACLGLAIGLGYYTISIIATVSVLFIIITLKRIEDIARNKVSRIYLDIKYENEGDSFITSIVEKVNKAGGDIKNIKIYKDKQNIWECKLEVDLVWFTKLDYVVNKVSSLDNIILIENISKSEFDK